MAQNETLLTCRQVLELTGYRSRVTLWRKVRAGEFPPPVALSTHAIRWPHSDVMAWIADLPRQDYRTPVEARR